MHFTAYMATQQELSAKLNNLLAELDRNEYDLTLKTQIAEIDLEIYRNQMKLQEEMLNHNVEFMTEGEVVDGRE